MVLRKRKIGKSIDFAAIDRRGCKNAFSIILVGVNAIELEVCTERSVMRRLVAHALNRTTGYAIRYGH